MTRLLPRICFSGETLEGMIRRHEIARCPLSLLDICVRVQGGVGNGWYVLLTPRSDGKHNRYRFRATNDEEACERAEEKLARLLSGRKRR